MASAWSDTDPAAAPARVAAFNHFFAHEEPDFPGWCNRLRKRLKRLHPAEVRLVADQAELLAAMPGANVVIAESLAVGRKEIAAAAGSLRIAQKYGTVLSNIDAAACKRARVRVLTLRRRANISCAEHALGLMLALARKIHESAGLVSVEQLKAAGWSPTTYDRAHTANANWARITGTRNLHGRQLGLIGFGATTRDGFTAMVEYAAPTFWMFMALVGLSLFIFRWREPGRQMPFRVPIYPLVPIVFCATALYLVHASVAYTGWGAVVGLAIVASGVPLYWLGHRVDMRSRSAPRID